ncbi:MAG: relaxase [Alphaproteobacteria bacterium]|nr:relaxase [Alphaproteobacteria bacterium]
MLLKASQRGGAKQLANHILRSKENEHVEVYDVRGCTSDNPNIAFQEMYALSRGTECRQFMFSLSLNPPLDEDVPPEYFENALASIEKEMGLENQPRVVVFHEKEGRRHAYCVWSRIDIQEMKAINLPFYKNKLNEISKQLYLEHGWELPKGYIDRQYSNPTNFSLKEWQQARRAKEDPQVLKALFKQSWEISDSKQAFAQALQEYGFILARGDRRGYVAVDYKGEVYSLSRWAGVKTKQFKERLGNPQNLPSIQSAKAEIGKKMTDVLERHIQEAETHSQQKFKPLKRAVQTMCYQHRAKRKKLKLEQWERWQHEEKERIARLPKGIKGLWHRITGKYRKIRVINEHETVHCIARDQKKKQRLIAEQLKERQKLQTKIQHLRHEHKETMLNIRLEIGHYLEMQEKGKDTLDINKDFNQRLHDKDHSFDMEQ